MLPLILGVALGIFTLVFCGYSVIAMRQAARFRYLSKRMVYLTLFFLGLSAVLFTLCYTAYLVILFN